MIEIKITYKGKQYNSLEDAAIQAAADGMKDLIMEKLKPFEAEIKEQNGSIAINLDEKLEGQLVVEGISKDLQRRIMKVLKT